MPSFPTTSQAVARLTSSVVGVLTTSTSGSTATGLKKWSPTTRSGWASPSAIAATESAEVFVTRRHSGDTIASSAPKTSRFTESSSKTASSTRSQPAYASLPSPVEGGPVFDVTSACGNEPVALQTTTRSAATATTSDVVVTYRRVGDDLVRRQCGGAAPGARALAHNVTSFSANGSDPVTVQIATAASDEVSAYTWTFEVRRRQA